jgi:hypothetical protein
MLLSESRIATAPCTPSIPPHPDPTAAKMVDGLLLPLVGDASPGKVGAIWLLALGSTFRECAAKEIVARLWQKQQCLARSTGVMMRAVNPQGRGQHP